MKCVRCGYCCIHNDVVIVDNPKLGPSSSNLEFKPGGERCKHLEGSKPGEFSCKVHDEEWYCQTPCCQAVQVEQSPDEPCRIGTVIMQGMKKAKQSEKEHH